MAVVSLDALAQRRELIEARAELEELRRRHQRSESALESLRDVLSSLPIPVEVIAEDLLIHYANGASRERHGRQGQQIEGTSYYATLLGMDSPPESCPVLTALREGREVELAGENDGQAVAITLTPTTLSGGQKAVVRSTRAAAVALKGDASPPKTPAEPAPATESPARADAAPATADALHLARDIETLREVASIATRTLNSGRLFKLLLPVLAQRLDAEVVLYYKSDDPARRFALQGAITPDSPSSPPEALDRDDYTALHNGIHVDAPYVHIRDLDDANTLPEPIGDYLLRSGAREALLIPARSPIARYGAMIIAREKSRPSVAADHDRLLTALAQLLGSSIERNNLVRALRRNVTTVMDLQRAGMEVTAADDIDSVFERFSRTALRVLSFDAVRVRVQGLTGMAQGYARSFPGPFPLEESLTSESVERSARALERGSIEIIDTSTPLRIVVDAGHEAQLAHCHTITVAPMHIGERIHGVVQLFGGHSREDILAMKPVLTTLVEHAAAALHQCERKAELNRRLENVAGEERVSVEILDEIQDGVAVIDDGGRVIQSNRALHRLLGIADNRTPRLRDIVFSGLRGKEVSDRELALGLFERAPLTGDECHVTTVAGERIPAEMSATLVGAASDKLLLIFRDVRTIQGMEKQLVDALGLSLAGEHIASLAHQVNNYLQPAFYHTDILSKNMLLDARTRHAVSTVQNYLHLCHESILMVLQFIRPAVPSSLDLNEVIEEMLSRQYFASEQSSERISIARNFDEDMPQTLGYRIQLQEALSNIIKNAQEAIIESGWGSKVSVVTEATPATITIRVSDDGPGMSSELCARVFDLGVSAKASGKGTGVGLHFARAIVRKHRGTISVSSTEGRGTEFEIRLPVRDSEGDAVDTGVATRVEPCRLERPDGPSRSGRVLIIDDEPAILELVRDILEPEQHTITVTGSAAEALEILRHSDFDCIICDVKMPEMDGCLFSGLLKDQHPDHYGRLVFATGDIFCEDTDGFIQSSGIPCVAKPFTADRLQGAVQYILANGSPDDTSREERRVDGAGA